MGQEPDRIRAEIEQTRADMSETVDALGAKADVKTRGKPFFLMLSHKALHPNIVQHADGSTSAIGEGGFVPAERHRSLYAAGALPRARRLARRLGPRRGRDKGLAPAV